MQKEKVDINDEKDSQITMPETKIVTLHLLFIFLLLCSYCDTDTIRKLELCLLVVLILL